MRRVGRAGALIVVVSLASLVAGYTAWGGAGEGSPVTTTLGPGSPNQAFPAVSAAGSSGFDAVWTGPSTVMTAHWSAATQSWSAPTSLSAALPASGANVAGSASGAAAAVWAVGSSGLAHSIQASYRPAAGGAWEPAATMFSGRPQSVADNPQVGVDDQGDAFVVWGTDDGALHLAEHAAGATGWSQPVVVLEHGISWFAVSPRGTLAVAWERHLTGGVSPDSPSRNLLYVKVKPAGSATWLPTRSLGAEDLYGLQNDGPPGTYFAGPRLAINASGTVFAAWQWLHHGNFYPRAAILPASRRWRPTIVTLPRPGLTPAIAGDDRGFATVLWDSPLSARGPAYITEGELSPRGRVLTVRRLGTGSESVMAADGNGDVVAAWIGYGAQVRPAGQRWCPRARVSDAREVAVAIAPGGVAQLVWHYGSDNSTNTAMMASTLIPCRP